MVGFSVDGLVSGLDTTNLVNQLMQVEASPQRALQSRVVETNREIAAYQAINTRYKALETAANLVADPATWTAPTASSSSASVTASSVATGSVGQLDFDVTAVARAHSLATAAFADINEIVPVWPAALSGVKNGEAFAITVTDASAEGVVTAINQATDGQGDPLGLRASLLEVSPGSYRIQVSATETGAENQFTLVGLGTTSLVRTGADATIDLGGGLVVSSATNTFADVLPGTTFTVSQVESGITVRAAVSPDKLADRMAAMVAAANAALSEAAKQATAGVAGAASGPLVGESTVRTLQQRTLAAVGAIAGEAPSTAGIELDRNGKLTFDRARFLDLMASEPDRAQTIASGVAGALEAVATGATDATSGSVTLAIQGRDSTVEDLGNRIENWDVRLDLRRNALLRQFSAMELALSSLQSQSAWLAGQIAALPQTQTNSP